ncbi:hypothetical protein PVAP13_1KG110930 [Panicum virgatum]|uniref:Uncharacterized protein n=1 Tax=Panicum virgatum TaxID=38727 RepID=A0A8T0Y2Z8_PANVG|nr:hypothetical protein PVAP13_1KG110930 [Panicum virgatum]
MPDPTQIPVLRCGCGRDAFARRSGTPRNPGRRFLTCSICNLFIWEDLLNKYAEDMVFYFHSASIDCNHHLLENMLHVVEHGLGHLPITEKLVITQQV